MAARDYDGARSGDGRRPRSGCRTCCLGCLGVLGALVIVAVMGYGTTGRYRPRIDPPARPPVPNGYDDYIAAGAMLKANGGDMAMYGTKPGTEDVIIPARREVIVDRNAAAMARMRSAFGKQCLAPPIRSAYDRAPYLADFRAIARFLSAKSDMLAERGDRAGAFDAALDAWQMGHDIPRGGVVINGLVAIACQAIAARPMTRVVEGLSASECDRSVERMQAVLRKAHPATRMLSEERNCLLSSMLELDRSPEEFLQMATGISSGATAAERIAGRVGWRFIRDRNIKALEVHFDSLEREWRKPPRQRMPVAQPTELIAAMVVPVFSLTIAKWERTAAQDRVILCTLAIRSYRLKHGRLPSSLGDLAVDAALRQDPYTGMPLRYQVLGKDYLLYSVGPDFRDDGGQPADETSNPMKGDLGITPFRTPRPGASPGYDYRRVPHMKPPRLAPGAPALLE